MGLLSIVVEELDWAEWLYGRPRGRLLGSTILSMVESSFVLELAGLYCCRQLV